MYKDGSCRLKDGGPGVGVVLCTHAHSVGDSRPDHQLAHRPQAGTGRAGRDDDGHSVQHGSLQSQTQSGAAPLTLEPHEAKEGAGEVRYTEFEPKNGMGVSHPSTRSSAEVCGKMGKRN